LEPRLSRGEKQQSNEVACTLTYPPPCPAPWVTRKMRSPRVGVRGHGRGDGQTRNVKPNATYRWAKKKHGSPGGRTRAGLGALGKGGGAMNAVDPDCHTVAVIRTYSAVLRDKRDKWNGSPGTCIPSFAPPFAGRGGGGHTSGPGSGSRSCRAAPNRRPPHRSC